MRNFLQALTLLLGAAGFSVADHAVGTEFAVPGASAQQPQMTAGTGRNALSRLWSGEHYLLCRVLRWRQIVWASQRS